MAQPAQPTDDAPTTLPEMTVVGRDTGLVGEATAASQGYVGMADLDTRPFLRRGELLEVVPGLIITQHSGSGKANQYFLRGFNLDHGTDFASTVDGMPVNMRSNAHGQGYSDLNFIIPELVQSIAYEKGTYFAENGDFSMAGAAQFRLVDSLPRGFVKVETGDYDYLRLVTADSFKQKEGAALTLGFEAVYDNGPWVLPENAKRFNGFAREVWSSGGNDFALTLLAYHGEWNSTDQVPLRAITSGLISTYGNIDPTDGGESDRASLSFDWKSVHADSTTKLNLYAIYYRLSLYSDFTFRLTDPVNGDQFNQRDRRGILGGSAEQEWTGDLAGHKVTSTLGLQTRADAIDLGLNNTVARNFLSVIRDDTVQEQSVGLFGKSQVQLTDWFRAEVGLRGDLYGFDVSSSNPANSGNREAAILSPKLNLVFGPWDKTEVYFSAGDGFHSNDARGTTTTVNPSDGSPVTPASPLVRGKGAELGVRTTAAPGLVSTVSLWVLDLDSELVFSGDGGDTEASGPTRRYGVEWANFYRPVSWLTLDADLALTHARYLTDSGTAPNIGRYIPNSIGTTLSAGAVLQLSDHWSTSLRMRYFGPQPLVEDNSVIEPSSLTFNGRLGWHNQDWDVALDVLNLFNRFNYDIAYYYPSQLAGELAPVNDVHVHPAEPRQFRVSVTRRF